MKKFFIGVVVSIVALTNVFADNGLSQEKLFNATIKEVDMGGVSLQYQKLENLEAAVLSLIELSMMSDKQAALNPMAQVQLALAMNSLKGMVKKANLNAIQSVAASIKNVNDNTYLNKAFIYTGNQPTGLLYDIMGRENKGFNYLKIVPEDAVFACTAHVDMGLVYNALYNGVLKNNPMVAQYIPLLEMQFGMPLADFMKTLSGEYVSFVTTAITETGVSAQYLIRIPDNAGNLSNFLKMVLGTQEAVVQLPANQQNPNIAPVIVFAEKSIIVATNKLAIAQSMEAENSGKNILTNANFAPYREYIQNNGLSQCFVALDQTQMQLLNSLLVASDVNYSFKPAFAIIETQVTEDGYKVVMPSSFNLASPADILATKAALMKMVSANAEKLKKLKDMAK